MTELSIRPEEIRDALQKYVADYQPEAASKEEVGTVAQAGDARHDMLDAIAAEERVEWHRQILARTHAGGNPDQRWRIDKLGLGRNHGDFAILVALADFTNGGEAAKATADDGDAAHVCVPCEPEAVLRVDGTSYHASRICNITYLFQPHL